VLALGECVREVTSGHGIETDVQGRPSGEVVQVGQGQEEAPAIGVVGVGVQEFRYPPGLSQNGIAAGAATELVVEGSKACGDVLDLLDVPRS
jgi:hypothetical protein